MFIEALEDRQMFSATVAPLQSVGEAQNFKVSIATVRQNLDDSAGATVVRGIGTGLGKTVGAASTVMSTMGMAAGSNTLTQTFGLVGQMQNSGGTSTQAG